MSASQEAYEFVGALKMAARRSPSDVLEDAIADMLAIAYDVAVSVGTDDHGAACGRLTEAVRRLEDEVGR